MEHIDFDFLFAGSLRAEPHSLSFNFPAKTSRGALSERKGVFLILKSENGSLGIGEAGPLEGLSLDYQSDLTQATSILLKLVRTQNKFDLEQFLLKHPAFCFALEMAIISAKNAYPFLFFHNAFFKGEQNIPINGLVWMGDKNFMLQQIADKIAEGYKCLKLKIGALDFGIECEILKTIRNKYDKYQIELRVDANGAFSAQDALRKIELLSKFDIHSIEQPIQTNQFQQLEVLCRNSPIPIALDEELIQLRSDNEKKAILTELKPQFIVLKPTLLGGFAATKTWISLANNLQMGWWITSALESNIGLNAIAQFVANFNPNLPQGLGTGKLYHNNFPSPLRIQNAALTYNKNDDWDIRVLVS